MKKEKGKYLIKYSSGVGLIMENTEIGEAIDEARREGINDPDLLLVAITKDMGGCTIDWKPPGAGWTD